MAEKFERNSPEYQSVAQQADDEVLEEPKLFNIKYQSHKTFLIRLCVLSHVLLFGFYAFTLLYVWNKSPSTASCDTKLSTHSPALPIITYTKYKLDAEIAQKNKYRGKPTPQIDAEWLKIGAGTPAIRLNDEDLKRLNKSDVPGRPLHRIPEEFGGGYLGMLEVFHLLHCVNSLRKAMYKEYYRDEWDKVGDAAMYAHNDHCLDMLRESIKCNSDVTPITFYDDENLPSRKLPMPDFSTLHTCRNFDEILSWNADNERTLLWDHIGLDMTEEMAD